MAMSDLNDNPEVSHDIPATQKRVEEIATKTYYLLVALGLLYQHYPDWLLSVAIVIALLNTFAIMGMAKNLRQLNQVKMFKTLVLNVSVSITIFWALMHLLE